MKKTPSQQNKLSKRCHKHLTSEVARLKPMSCFMLNYRMLLIHFDFWSFLNIYYALVKHVQPLKIIGFFLILNNDFF
jgi:hypothetical protein